MNRCHIQNKQKFVDEETAWAFALYYEMRYRLNDKTRNWDVYRCKSCNNFHLTEVSKKKEQNKRVEQIDFIKQRKIEDKKYSYIRIPTAHKINTAYNLMYKHLGIKRPKPKTVKTILTLEEQKKAIRLLTQKQSTGAI